MAPDTGGGRTFASSDLFSPLTEQDRQTVDEFSRLVWSRWTPGRPGGEGPLSIGWLGFTAQKSPLDLWIYQEILVETRPDVIIETGTCLGGSALYLATICDLIGAGRVVSVDVVEHKERPEHPRLRYVTGSSVDTQIIESLKSDISPGTRVMVILDSDHRCDHVLAELRAYADLVTPGCYLIVEDTIVSGNPVEPTFGPGPMDALDAFLPTRPDFAIDRTRERFLFTLNPKGYLRRIGQ